MPDVASATCILRSADELALPTNGTLDDFHVSGLSTAAYVVSCHDDEFGGC